MANPEVSRLIEELSSILSRNREKRNAAEAMMVGLQQGQAQAQARRAEAAAANGRAAGRGAYEAGKTAGAPSPAESGYGGDADVSPYSRKGGMTRVSASSMSPSTTREGRLKLGGDYARQQQLLSENPYRMEENAPEYRPNTDPALEEQKRRFTQNLMLSRGQPGGPLGGAGQRPQMGSPGSMELPDHLKKMVTPEAAQIMDAGSPSFPPSPEYPKIVQPDMVYRGGATTQPVGTYNGGARDIPAGWSPDDYALLESLSKRYPGG